MKMKLLIYMHDLKDGGAQKSFVILANELANIGIEVAIATLDIGLIGKQVSKKVTVYLMKSSRTLLCFNEFNSIVNNFKPTHMLTGLLQNNILLTTYKKLFQYKGKVIVSEHSIPSMIERQQMGVILKVCSLLRPLLYRLADKIVAVSDHCKNDLINNIGLPKHLITRIYNPVNITVSTENKPKLLENFNYCKSIIFIGRLHKVKRVDLLLYAFCLLKKDNSEVHLFIMGDGEERQSLELQVTQLELKSDVTFLGYVDTPSNFLKHMDCLVLSSSVEGFGNVVVEALANSVPVVSTRSAGPEEIIVDGVHGSLCGHTAESLKNSINKVLTSDFKSHDLVSRAKVFSPNCISLEYIEMFRNV